MRRWRTAICAVVLVGMSIVPGAAEGAQAAIEVSPPASVNAVAVVPFSNITREPTDDWIGSGIAETVIADLESVPGLLVLGREVIFGALQNLGSVEGADLDELVALDIGRRLGATWLVGGAYQRVGDLVRITARFVDVRTGAVLRRVKIDGRTGELFALQDQVVSELSEGLNLAVRDTRIAERSRLAREPEVPSIRPRERTPAEAPGPVPGAERTRRAGGLARTPTPVGQGGEIAPEEATLIQAAEPTPPPVRRRGVAEPVAPTPGGPAVGAVGPPANAEVRAIPRSAASSSTSGMIIDGPPPPIPPEVVSRDAQGRVTMWATRLSASLRLDGKLDEAIYYDVPAVSGFIQMLPNEGAPATEKTEAWVFFDGRSIYIAARCWDSVPEEQWVANEMRRDTNQLRQNDTFAVMLDTFYDRRNGVAFYANPIGGFSDFAITDEGNANMDWNPVWEVRTGRLNGGWTVEMEIPFKSLRYRPGTSQVWGIQLRRAVRRKNEWSHLTPIPISAGRGSGSTGIFRVSAAGTLVGLEVPGGSKNLEIKPYGISSVTTNLTADPQLSNDGDGDGGLDVKYGLTQNLTADFTYNTDFAQVEVDEQQVNLTRFSLFFPEKREFFLEGRGIFDFGRGGGGGRGGGFRGGGRGGGRSGGRGGGNAPTIFFSRRIGLNRGQAVPIQAGGRLTGKVGRFSVGALNIQTDDEPGSGALKTNFTVLRVKRDILRRSSIGGIFTGRSVSTVGDGSNEVYGLDTAFSFYDNVNFNGYYARTRTPGLDGDETSYQAKFSYDADRYGVQVDHLLVGDHFNPEVGFLRRDDFRRTFLSFRFSPRPRSIQAVRQFTWEGSLDYILNGAADLETRANQLRFDTEFENSDRFGVDFTRSYELLVEPFPIAPDVTIPVGGYGFSDVQVSYALGAQREASGSFSVQRGSFFSGNITALGYSRGRIEVTPQFSLEPSVSVNWVDLREGSFTTKLLRTRANYTFTPRMFFSGLLQYNSSNDSLTSNLRLRWEYEPGSELFVVYTEERDTAIRSFPGLDNRALVVKFNRLFRF